MNQATDQRFPNPLPQRFRRNARLLTGATGFLGKRLLPQLAPTRAAPVIALVRADTDQQALERGRQISDNPHVLWLRGDICEAQLGLNNATWQALAAATLEIFHSAASVEFNLPLAEAHRINVEGTARLLTLAEAAAQSEGFRCMHQVSTAYASGRATGPVTADYLPSDLARNFRNTYERTKARAERLLRGQSQVPVCIYRPSIIAGDTQTGATDNWNVLYAPMRQIQRGLLPVMPKAGSARVDVVGVDYVARSIAHLAKLPQQGCSAYHLTAGNTCFDIEAFVATCNERCEAFDISFNGQCKVAGRRQWQMLKLQVKTAARLPKTLATFTGAGKLRRWGKLAERALKGFAPYEPYTGVSTIFDNTWEARELSAANISMPVGQTYLARIVDYALQVDFGNSGQALRHPNPAAKIAASAQAALTTKAAGAKNPNAKPSLVQPFDTSLNAVGVR